MRLINADAVIAEQYDIFKKLYGGTAQTLKDHLDIDDDLSIPINAMEEYSKAKQFYFGLKGIVENASNVDAVPVVRCRECKYYDPEDWGGITCKADGGMTDPYEDSFCSQGERRHSDAN